MNIIQINDIQSDVFRKMPEDIWYIPTVGDEIDTMLILTAMGLVECNVALETIDGYLFKFRRKQLAMA